MTDLGSPWVGESSHVPGSQAEWIEVHEAILWKLEHFVNFCYFFLKLDGKCALMVCMGWEKDALEAGTFAWWNYDSNLKHACFMNMWLMLTVMVLVCSSCVAHPLAQFWCHLVKWRPLMEADVYASCTGLISLIACSVGVVMMQGAYTNVLWSVLDPYLSWLDGMMLVWAVGRLRMCVQEVALALSNAPRIQMARNMAISAYTLPIVFLCTNVLIRPCTYATGRESSSFQASELC